MFEFLLHLLIMTAIYSVLAVSFNLTAGYAGLFSVGHAAFYGLGAYTAAIACTQFGVGFFEALFLAAIVAGAGGVLVGLPSIRLRGDYLAFATLGLAELVQTLLRNWREVTGGWEGIRGIERPRFLEFAPLSTTSYGFLALAICVLCLWVLHRIVSSRVGLLLRAVREDQDVASTVGINVDRLKLKAFGTGAVFAGVAGGLYSYYARFIDPTSFTVAESILILAMVVLGGAGSFWGSIAGAALLIMIPESLRFVGVPLPIVSIFREIFYGSMLVVFMIWRPTGLIGKYGP